MSIGHGLHLACDGLFRRYAMYNFALSQSFAHLFTHAARDDQAKRRLKENPRDTLLSYGIAVPDDVEIEVVENTPQKYYVVIPDPGELPVRATRRQAQDDDDQFHGQPDVHLLE